MDLVVLGSGTTIPHGDRGCAAYALVARDGSVLLVDCGPGASRRFPLFGIDPRRIVGVLNTHHHADHCGDLAILLFLRNVLEPPMTHPWVVAGPKGHSAFVRGLESTFAAGLSDTNDSVAVVELGDGDSLTIGGFGVDAVEVEHIPGALGIRVMADGSSFCFSGDTGPCDALVSLCRGVDVALLECSYAAARETTKHLTTKTAAETATAAGVKQLVLTHFYPECLAVDIEAEVRAAGYRGDLMLARDGMRMVVQGCAAS